MTRDELARLIGPIIHQGSFVVADAILARYDLHPKGSVVVPAHLINAIIRIRRDIADFDGDRRGHYGALDDAEAALLDAIKAIAARPGASHD